jgi:ribosomal protein S13
VTIGKMKVTQLLQAQKGWGKAKVQDTIDKLGIAENRRVQGLGTNQIQKLIEAIENK